MATHYKRLRLTPDLISVASERAARQPIYGYSHRKGEANLVGCIGEVAFEYLLGRLGLPFEDRRAGTEHDYIVGGYTVDVKTKDRTVIPVADFDNSVPLYNHEHQRPDYYYFVSLYRDPASTVDGPGRFSMAYLLGAIDLQTLDREGARWEAGQTDPSNGTTFWTACINVKMSQLIPNGEILERFQAGKGGCRG